MPPIATRPRRTSGYLPSLDGWRAIAVLSVMMVHDYAYPIPYSVQGSGGYGLHLFFAISGILICSRILDEEARLGVFNIKGFYVRRVLRIQPAAYTYLIFAACAPLVGISSEGWRYWLSAVFFYRNYLPHDVPPIPFFANGHFWTLAVEEHFYIVLSLLFFFTTRLRLYALTGLVCLSFLWPLVERHFGLFDRTLSDHMTQDTLRYLLWPALLALLLQIPAYKQWALLYLRPWIVSLLALSFLLLDHIRPASGLHIVRPFILGADVDIVITLFPFWIIAAMLHPLTATTLLLETRPLRFVGRLSYSLYLWHVVFFVVRFGPTPQSHNQMHHFWLRAPWNYGAAFACALVSYYFVEKPLIRLGHRVAPPASAGREDLDQPEVTPVGVAS